MAERYGWYAQLWWRALDGYRWQERARSRAALIGTHALLCGAAVLGFLAGAWLWAWAQ